MIEINLSNPKVSEIEYKIISFSDTQKLISLSNPKRLFMEDTVRIRSRMSWDDLQIIIQVANILHRLQVQRIELLVPYMLGARSDRRFDKGGVNYIKDVIAPIINSLNFNEVTVTDPHSIAVESTINNIESFTILDTLVLSIINSNSITKFAYISPDEGAIKRTQYVANKIGIPNSLIIKCIKDRDISTGHVRSVNVLTDNLNNQPCIVVDDIADGGATFIELAKELKKKNAGDLYLCVAHGIFSKGFSELAKYYRGIITTNSVREFTKEELENVTVHRIT